MAPTPCCDLAAYIRPKKPTEDQVKRQIGQTFIASFEGSICSAEVQALLQLYAVGNVLLTAQNLDDVSQVIRLLQAMQESARTAQQPVPLLIGIEQEGGL
ncbi:hypothetical protein MMC14_010238, partial [Varicellaria rhodocarpa]|nr:hypothetical protein [Varicellaria rhodocarpa]